MEAKLIIFTSLTFLQIYSVILLQHFSMGDGTLERRELNGGPSAEADNQNAESNIDDDLDHSKRFIRQYTTSATSTTAQSIPATITANTAAIIDHSKQEKQTFKSFITSTTALSIPSVQSTRAKQNGKNDHPKKGAQTTKSNSSKKTFRMRSHLTKGSVLQIKETYVRKMKITCD